MRAFALLFFAVSIALGQTNASLELEVASIKPSPPDHPGAVGCQGGPGTSDPVLLVCGNLSLGNLLIRNYGFDYCRIAAPDWIWPTHFNIRARVPEGTTRMPGVAWTNGLARRYYRAVTVAFVVNRISFGLAKPVHDETGVQGEYEIGLGWVFDAQVDQSLDLELIEALRDQLGLRLVSRKGPIEFLVVDRAARVPSEN
jgi:Protein of unknown function (DUF3738)